MKKTLDLKEKLALAVIDPLVAQTRAWQDTEEATDELKKGVAQTNDNINQSKDEIITSLNSQIGDLSETLKKKLDEELSYEVDEKKIVDSVLSQVKIPDPIPGKDANEGAIIEKMVPLVLEKMPKQEIDINEIARTAAGMVPKQKPQIVKQIDQDKVVAEVLGKIPKSEPFKFELSQDDLLGRINKFDKEVDWKVLKNVPYDVLHSSPGKGKKGGGGSSTFRQLTDVSVPNPTNGQVPVYNSTTGKWEAGSVTSSPGGSDTQVQFNDGGAFGGDAGFTYNKTTDTATLGYLALSNMTDGSVPFIGASGLVTQSHDKLHFEDSASLFHVSSGQLSATVITNGTFTGSATGWTVGSGWAYSSNSVSKTSNGTATLNQTITTRIGVLYKLTYTVSALTVGTVTGAGGVARSANGTYIEYFVASATTTSIAFTPSNTARLTIDNVIVQISFYGSISTGSEGSLTSGNLKLTNNTSNPAYTATPTQVFYNQGTVTNLHYHLSNSATPQVALQATATSFDTVSGKQQYFIGTPSSYVNSCYNDSTGLYHYINMLASKMTMGSASTLSSVTSDLANKGNTALKVERLIANTTLTATSAYTQILCDGTNSSSCTGTPSTACSTYVSQATCENYDAHGGCTWSAGSSCSVYNNESGMTTCSGTSGCTAVTSACSGGDQATCESGDDSYGGSCVWSDPIACTWDEGTLDCSGDPACDAGDNTDQATCEAITYGGECSGTYYTGSCTGTYGASCSGTATCTGINDSTNCGLETGCAWTTGLQLNLPDGETCVDRTWWIKNDSSGGADITIVPHSGQTVEKASSLTLANYQDAVHIAYYKQTYDCANYVTAGTCTPTGCTATYTSCTWDEGTTDCSGNVACDAGDGTDQATCEAITYFTSCSGTEIVAKNWYIF